MLDDEDFERIERGDPSPDIRHTAFLIIIAIVVVIIWATQ